MMGFAIGDLDTPITKGTLAITALTTTDVARPHETPCIRCGRCVDTCPMGLVPSKLALASRVRQWEVVERYAITACMECGCCEYVCPASVPLVQLIRMGKARKPD